MAIHNSYVLDNNTGANFRIDLNNLLLALKTSNSSPTAPPNPVAGMFWTDTSASPVLLKLRDPTNSAWLTIFNITSNSGIIATQASNTSSLGNISKSTIGNTPNTIMATDNTTTTIKNNVIGNCSGYAATVGGKTLANIHDMSTKQHASLSRKNSGVTTISSCYMSTQQATAGSEILVSYKSNIKGPIKVIHKMTHSGNPGVASYYISINGIQVGGTYSSVASAAIEDAHFHDATSDGPYNITVGDTIDIVANIPGATGTDFYKLFAGITVHNVGSYVGEFW